jgi:dipeptidyl aminopeptidase/acylaminoacyl peptidase
VSAFLSRRSALRLALGAAGAALWSEVASSTVPPSARMPRQRPFSWKDASSRYEVESVAVSPSGHALAVQVTRPLVASGAHAGSSGHAVQPRGEIWILNENLGAPTRLALGDLWAWAPSFSPQGTQLAALVSKGNGRVGLVVWNLRDLRSRAFLDLNVDVYVKFNRAGVVTDASPAMWQQWRQFEWLAEYSLLYVASGDLQNQFDLATASGSASYSSRRDRSARGDVSVRVWSDASPTCGAGRSLARLECNTGRVETLYRADIRGVSVSPNCRWAAAPIATGHVRLSPDKPVEPALRTSSVGDDPLVSLALARIDLLSELPTALVPRFEGTGNVAPSRLPVWADDSKRFAVPARSSYSSALSTADDACWEVSVDSLRARKWQATSALDAELLAAMIVSAPELHDDTFIQRRPPITMSPATHPWSVGQINGAVWRYDGSSSVLWASPTITLVSPAGTVAVPGQYSSAYSPVTTPEGATMFAVRTNGKGCAINLTGLTYQIEEIALGPEWVYLGTRGSDGAVVAKEDAKAGTSIAAFMPRRRKLISTLRFNLHFREIAQAERRELEYRSTRGELLKGVLQLPIERSSTGRHPVIVWAYPDQQPSMNDSLTRLNSPMAALLPFQYLLARGFAIFHAPLSTESKRLIEPIDMVTDAVLPWLDVLEQQVEIIAGEYGFFGHSNAGYVALALEAMTTRFKAIVASSTFPDLAAAPLSSAMDKMVLDCAGQVIQADRFYYEDANQPYTFGGPFWRVQQKFIRNSPLYRMSSAATPMLLIEGEFDFSPRQMESVFSILYGLGIPVEMAHYWGEGHVISSPGNIKDVWERTDTFFRKYMRMS